MKVLIVDDTDTLRSLVLVYLMQRGWEFEDKARPVAEPPRTAPAGSSSTEEPATNPVTVASAGQFASSGMTNPGPMPVGLTSNPEPTSVAP